jgi:phosphopantetheinyl transferase (holo-ACP synthase)
MVTPSSTWLFESNARLAGCGIDVERVERFRRFTAQAESPLPLVFSETETSHALRLADPAAALCAAFCAKEALFKALRAPFDYDRCELLLDPGREIQDLHVPSDIAREHSIASTKTLVRPGNDGTMLAMVYVFREER